VVANLGGWAGPMSAVSFVAIFSVGSREFDFVEVV